jgi:hypothetical protein
MKIQEQTSRPDDVMKKIPLIMFADLPFSLGETP